MKQREIPNSSLMFQNTARFAPIIFLVAFSLLLAACGVGTPDITPAPVTLPAYAPSATSIPPPTSQPSLLPTSTPTALPALPDPAGYTWKPVISGLEAPVDIQNAGDGSGRLFIIEKRGRIRILQNDQLLAVPFLDIQSEVGSQHSEQGLLGLAFHPNYAVTGLFFINFTDVNGNTVIARFHVSVNDPNRADPANETVLLHVKQPFENHNGGGLAFGPDGYLYIGLGDGGSAGDPLRNAQNLQTMLGKMLRIDISHGDKYSIPPDNPFVNAGGLPEIWAYGLRNPWRFSFDKASGDLFIADVGQDAWEEVDFVPSGEVPSGTPGDLNFGWSFYEGLHPYQDQPPANARLTLPVFEYSHSEGCSITGGYVFRGRSLPEWQGVYFWGDYCSGNIWVLVHPAENSQQAKILFTTGAQISTFGVDQAGEIYLADYKSGSLLRLTHK